MKIYNGELGFLFITAICFGICIQNPLGVWHIFPSLIRGFIPKYPNLINSVNMTMGTASVGKPSYNFLIWLTPYIFSFD